MKGAIKNDLVIGVLEGVCEGPCIPEQLITIPTQELRLDKGIIVWGKNYNKFYVDEFGTKHIIQYDQSWQPISCSFDDELILDNNQWRVKNKEDKYQEKIEELKIKRRKAYTAEADPLKNEYDFDLISSPAKAETKKLQWLAKVKEVKARYPFPSRD